MADHRRRRHLFPDAATAAQTQPPQPGRTGLWVLLVSGSTGVVNTRHQADVLAYQALLRRNGVAQDHIVTVADDLVHDGTNPEPGVVRNEVGGDLLDGATIDLRPDALDASACSTSSKVGRRL